MATVRRAFTAFWGIVKRHPVRAQAAVQAIIAVATSFGLGWTAVQVGSVMALSAALLAFVTESAVTPLEAPVIPAGTDVTVITPGAAPNETVTV